MLLNQSVEKRRCDIYRWSLCYELIIGGKKTSMHDKQARTHKAMNEQAQGRTDFDMNMVR